MTGVPGWGRTGPDIVAEIEMVKTNWPGPFLVVEGPSDECFFASRVPSNVYITQAGGKRNVEATFALLDCDASHAATVALGIVDEDYDWLTGHCVGSTNIIKFDPRDLEGLLLRSRALDSVLAELADRAAVANFVASNGPVRDALVARADFFGRIRMLNAQGPQVCLRKLKPQRFCDVRTWAYDHQQVLAEAVKLGVHPDVASLSVAISSLTAPTNWHVVRGHDLVDILVGGLLGVLRGSGSVSARDVERILRQSIPISDVHSSGFFSRLSSWQLARRCVYL